MTTATKITDVTMAMLMNTFGVLTLSSIWWLQICLNLLFDRLVLGSFRPLSFFLYHFCCFAVLSFFFYHFPHVFIFSLFEHGVFLFIAVLHWCIVEDIAFFDIFLFIFFSDIRLSRVLCWSNPPNKKDIYLYFFVYISEQ